MNDSDRVAAEVEFELNVNKIMEQIKKIASAMGVSFKEAVKQFDFSNMDSKKLDEITEAMRRLREEAKQAAEETKKTKDEVNKTGDTTPKVNSLRDAFSSLSSAVMVVGQALLGLRALQWVKTQLTEAIEMAEEFSKSLYRLEVAIRAMQRAGSEITFESTWQGIQKMREEYGIFTTKDLVSGYAQMYNLTRELGLAEKDIEELIQASATLSIVTGQNIYEAQRMMAMALSSGYTEGLQRLGIAISRYSIALKANSMGLGENYMSLSEHDRALATKAIIMEQVNRYAEDAAEYEDTYAGKIDSTKAKIQEYYNFIGSKFLPIWANLLSLFSRWVEFWDRFESILNPIMSFMLSFGAVVSTLTTNFSNLFDVITGDISIKEWAEKGTEAVKDLVFQLKNIWSLGKDQPDTTLGNTEVGETKGTEEQIAQNIDEVLGDIEGVWEDHNEKMAKLARDLQSDLEKTERDGANRREELARQLAYRLESLERNYNQKIAKAGRDYQNSLAKIHEDQQRKIEEITQKYRDKELDAEAKHIEALRKLRERLIFDVEEAARVRDASAARKALREYQLNRSQTVRDFEIDKEARARDYQRDIEAARQAEQQKREEAWIAYQQRLEDTRLQYEFDRKEAQIKYKQDLDELRISMANQRKERMISYREQQRDLIRAYEERLKAVASALVAEYGMIQDAGTAITKLLASIYGPNSAIDQIMKYYYDLLGGAGAAAGTNPFRGVTGGVTAGGMASGGTFLASQPTLLAVGENGMERVTVEPIGYRGATENMTFGNAGGDYSGLAGSKMGIDIFLSPGLESRIIKKSNDVMTNELVKVFRRRG
jgi:hypothetical protein